MVEGFLYCFSNPSMPGTLKVGMTERTPEIRLAEANASDTWRPPTPYAIEFAKQVKNPKEKEKTLHALLEQYTERINPRREFFRVSIAEVQKFFDLMDGIVWTASRNEKEIQTDDEEEDAEEVDEEDIKASSSSLEKQARKQPKGCRDMTRCFINGQQVRHTIGVNNTWTAIYDSTKNRLVCNGIEYKAMCAFANAHWKYHKPDSNRHADGWGGCECEVNGKWISTYSLPG
jgi:hypothetical protein